MVQVVCVVVVRRCRWDEVASEAEAEGGIELVVSRGACVCLQAIGQYVHQPHWYANATVFIVVASFCAVTFAIALFLKVKNVK